MRTPDPVPAGCLGAATDGLERELELPLMVTGDPHADAQLVRLPVMLEAALPYFAESELARQIYGEVFVDTFVTMLEHEIGLFNRQVTDWENARYREVM